MVTLAVRRLLTPTLARPRLLRAPMSRSALGDLWIAENALPLLVAFNICRQEHGVRPRLQAADWGDSHAAVAAHLMSEAAHRPARPQ